MPIDINGQRIREKQQTLAVLLQQYKASEAQKRSALSDADKITIDIKGQQIWTAIEKTQAEIEVLQAATQKMSARGYRQVSRSWEENLHKINFSEVEALLSPILVDLKRTEGSALFLLERSSDMGGRWCAQKIRYQIESNLGILSPPCEIGFTNYQRADSVEFLNKMAEHFAVDIQPSAENIGDCIQALLDKIVHSLISGQTFLIEVNLFALAPQDNFLEWFVNDFWRALISRLPAVAADKRMVRLMAIISVAGSIPEPCLPGRICCESTAISDGKMLNLPLRTWTESEICDWLFNFSGLTAHLAHLPGLDIEQMAKNIHSVTVGEPKKVHDELLTTMTDILC